MISEMIVSILEWIGTVAFAVSGSLVAISCSLDLFGVLTVGCVTAVGGGIMRDLLIGKIPPQIFFRPMVVLVAILTSLAVFIIAYVKRDKFASLRERLERLNVLFDALGLATFSVAGVEVACASAYADNTLLAITLGMLTGVGGGVLRDVLVNEKPYVLTRHIYAVASIVGSGVYYVMSYYLHYRVVGTVVAVLLTLAIRILAATFRWKLPKIRLDEESMIH